MIRSRSRGFTLLELIAAVIIASMLMVLSIRFMRPPAEAGSQRSCDLTRQLLQNDADRFLETVGRSPSRDLRELRSDDYSGVVLPTCPVTGEPYSIDNSGVVVCPTHEATR